MILLKNKIKKIKLNKNKIKKDLNKILNYIGYKNFDLGILFTTNQTIKKYNKKYRKKNIATDILSFPYHTNIKPEQKIKIKNSEDKNLGDIIISLEFAQKKAIEQKQSLEKYIQILLVHGIAHLLGYTHDTNKNYFSMNKFEQTILKHIK